MYYTTGCVGGRFSFLFIFFFFFGCAERVPPSGHGINLHKFHKKKKICGECQRWRGEKWKEKLYHLKKKHFFLCFRHLLLPNFYPKPLSPFFFGAVDRAACQRAMVGGGRGGGEGGGRDLSAPAAIRGAGEMKTEKEEDTQDKKVMISRITLKVSFVFTSV